MLNFKNMTFQNYLDLLGCYYTSEQKSEIDNLNIKTIEDLENIISNNPDLVPNYLLYWYDCIKKEFAKIERKFIFASDNSLFSDLSSINSEDLNATEKNTLVKDLITEGLVSDSWNVTFFPISQITIEDIRLFFQYKNNDKFLINNVRKMGNKSIQSLINGLNFYESQILRQNKNEHLPGTDLFAMDREKKRQIVEEEIMSYIDYIEQYAELCIWGKVTKHQIDLMHRAFSSDKANDIRNRERIINTFTNYFTLLELEDGVVKKQTLDRFIIK